MTDLQIDRHAVMIVVGGGVLGDMGGFCAATYKRGIDFVLIPTTLLAQVDASIGGKLGIDFNNYKNHIGVYQQPVLTLLYSGFLPTLPYPELRSGFAEVIKHILISDSKLWEKIRHTPLADQQWEKLIKHSVQFKADIITKDPREKGLRKILNAGHTIGHALETYFINIEQRILHGEAIAVGQIAEGFIALKKGLLKESELSQMVGFIKSIFGKVEITENQIEEIAKLAMQDKKNKNNRILCVLQRGIGDATWDNEISTENLKEALQYYRSQI
jgi:3-dehydroquinate synthase